MNRTIYLGPPGTGKTTTLLRKLEALLSSGVPVERIAFLTFTRRARQEALERVEKQIGKTAKELPYFRTIHSMAYRALALQPGDVMGTPELAEFGQHMGLQFGKTSMEDQVADGINSQNKGDYLLAVDGLARLRGQHPKVVWGQTAAAETRCDWPTVEHFVNSYAVYREEKGLLDFTGVLETFAKSDIDLPIDIAFIDEAQDLSALQWWVALKACRLAKEQYVAGDDDQAIFQWAGADVEYFQQLEGDRQVLHLSHRLPRAVHHCAQGILSRIKTRIPKQFAPRDAPGKVVRHAQVQALVVEKGDDWLWLVRNRYLMASLRDQLELAGVVYATHHGQTSIVESDRTAIYTWERLRKGGAVPVTEARDLYAKLRTRTQVKHGYKALTKLADDDHVTLAQLQQDQGLLVPVTMAWFDMLDSIPMVRRIYYRKLLRTHNTLKLPVQVRLETIHGAKGAEANKVALLQEMSGRVAQEFRASADNEHRVWYVGATRAREELHWVTSRGINSYRVPND